MNFLNQAQVIGNITRDPDIRQTKTGQPVCTLGVATNRRWRDSGGQIKEEAEFHNIVCWGKLAELAGRLLQKGTKVFFQGRLQTRSWDDEAGAKHFRTEIVAQDMIVLSKGKAYNDEEGTVVESSDEFGDIHPEPASEEIDF